MPTPYGNETESEYISRCMGDPEAISDFPNEEQRLAFCYSKWNEKATYRGEEIDLTPTDEMAEEAKRGLAWREEFNRGGTEVGVARARDISNKRELSPETIRRMVSYFARHEVDKEAEGFSRGEEGYPSAGRIAWALWGGDAGQSWANAKASQMDRIDESKSRGKSMTQRKMMDFNKCEIKTSDRGMFEGYASVFDGIDSYNDSIVRGAYKNTLANRKRDVAMYFNHASYRSDMPARIGKWTQMEEDDKGLYVKGQLSLGHPTADAIYAGMINQTLDGLSIGFMIPENGYEMRNGIRYLKQIDLVEISVVDNPADNEARISLDSVKSQIESLKSIRDAEEFLRDSVNLSNSGAKALLAQLKSILREEVKTEMEQAMILNRINQILKG
jgi:HK97 family phage prohead protease